ncbi:MAG: hypothetical protein AAGI34_16475 [Pseudomonadota bacterium]
MLRLGLGYAQQVEELSSFCNYSPALFAWIDFLRSTGLLVAGCLMVAALLLTAAGSLGLRFADRDLSQVSDRVSGALIMAGLATAGIAIMPWLLYPSPYAC